MADALRFTLYAPVPSVHVYFDDSEYMGAVEIPGYQSEIQTSWNRPPLVYNKISSYPSKRIEIKLYEAYKTTRAKVASLFRWDSYWRIYPIYLYDNTYIINCNPIPDFVTDYSYGEVRQVVHTLTFYQSN